MLKHTFSDFSYAVNIESAKKGYKEILVCYIYNGIEVLRKVYIPEGNGISYIFEARKIIDKEIKDGTLSSYSYKFIRRNKKRIVRASKPKNATELIGTNIDNAPILRIGKEPEAKKEGSPFSNFAYELCPYDINRKKEVRVSFLYNGNKVIRTHKFRKKMGTDYIAKSKDKINDEIKSGFLKHYSEKYLFDRKVLDTLPTKQPIVRTGTSAKAIAAICIVAALIIAGTTLGVYFGTRGNPQPAPINNLYLVEFDTMGGTSPHIESQRIEEGKKVTKPEDPKRGNDQFNGWYKDARCTGLPYEFNTPVDSDFVLYAGYNNQPDAYMVQFDSDGGTHVNTQFVEAGGKVEEPRENPTRGEDTFLGWYIDATKYVFDTPVNSDLKLKAHWEAPLTVRGKYEKIVGKDNEAIVVGVDVPDEELPTVRNLVIDETTEIDGTDCRITQIKEGALAGCSILENVTLPFIGGYYDIADCGFEPIDPKDTDHVYDYAQLFGYVFGKNIYDGVGKLTWQTFYRNSSGLEADYRITKAAIPFSLRRVTITRGNKPVDGKAIIPQGAFSECKRLSYIDMQQSGESNEPLHYHIEDYAFANCTALTKVNSPEGAHAEIIDGHALENCGIIESFVLDGCTSIGKYAFANCDGINGINITSEIATIGEGAFSGVQSPTIACELTRTEVDGRIASGDWDEEWIDDTAMIVYGFVDSKVYRYEDYQYIKVKLDAGGNGACLIDFTGSDREDTYTLPGTLDGLPLVEIASSTFYSYSLLKKVIFTNCTSLNMIGNYCFLSCTSLETIEGLDRTKVDMIGAYAFDRCGSLKIADTEDLKTFPASLTKIGKFAFANCVGSGSLQIDLSNTGITDLGESIFAGSKTLKDFISPHNLNDIGDGTFEGCTQIVKIILNTHDVSLIPNDIFKDCLELTTVIINTESGGQTIKDIGNGAFSGCKKLHTVGLDLSTRLATIGDEAFMGCLALDDISCGEQEGDWNISALSSIGSRAFKGCTGISKIDWTDTTKGVLSLTFIGDEAFSGCANLKTVNMYAPKLEELGEGSFSNCTGMTSFKIANSEATTRSDTFGNFTTIGKDAFKGSNKIATIFNDGNKIPDSIEYIGDTAFADCSGLKSIHFNFNSAFHSNVQGQDPKMYTGLQIFDNWSSKNNQAIYIDEDWTFTRVSSTHLTYWGWNLSLYQLITLTQKYFCAAATGEPASSSDQDIEAISIIYLE